MRELESKKYGLRLRLHCKHKPFLLLTRLAEISLPHSTQGTFSANRRSFSISG